MFVRRSMIVVGLFLGMGCAANMTPEQKALHEIFLDTAYRCESQYHTIHVDQIGLDGGLQIHADADSRTEYRAFVACYIDGLKARAEVLRKAGQPVPEGLTREPDVELD